eukprot:357052-Chlamydomonas_euryale.AAC.3
MPAMTSSRDASQSGIVDTRPCMHGRCARQPQRWATVSCAGEDQEGNAVCAVRLASWQARVARRLGWGGGKMAGVGNGV